MRISDWSSDVCSSDLERLPARDQRTGEDDGYGYSATARSPDSSTEPPPAQAATPGLCATSTRPWERRKIAQERSEEHTSELQSLMRISYAVFCLKNKKNRTHPYATHSTSPKSHRKITT